MAIPTRAPKATTMFLIVPVPDCMSESLDILVPTVYGLYWEAVDYFRRTRCFPYHSFTINIFEQGNKRSMAL